MSDIVENYMIDSEKHLIAACKEQRARIAALEAAIREYLGEYDTPAKDTDDRRATRLHTIHHLPNVRYDYG